MNELSSFVYYRTYSRWLQSEGRRETWREAVRRAVEYNVQIGVQEMQKYSSVINKSFNGARQEAEMLFDNIFNLKQFLSGRTHWVGGADSGVAEKFPLANFNCSFINITRLDEEQNDLADLFYLLLVGTGVGFKCTRIMADNLPPLRSDVNVVHAEYRPLPKAERIEHTQLNIMENGYATMWVGDSKEGWVKALKLWFDIHISNKYFDVHTLKISYNSIRPNGERLLTFGGTASGHEPLMEMFQGFSNVITNNIDSSLAPLETYCFKGKDYHAHPDSTPLRKLRPIHILDMGNLIGHNVVVGGVRRTAEIFLCDADDWEVILAKYGINGIWNEEHHLNVKSALHNLLGYIPDAVNNIVAFDENTRPLHHRRMSNNSIAFESKPSEEMLSLIFLIMQGEGEPGFVNLEEARRRRPNAEGLNPCAEILLDSYGVCNLTTVNVSAFVDENGEIDAQGLMQAQALSARAGIRMTCLQLELPHWDIVQKRDRLIGTSLTGWKDAVGKANITPEQEGKLLNMLRKVVADECIIYCHILRIPTPLVDTTVKPEGTLSQVAGGVSSGLHVSHAPYYIRRIRINAKDPLARVAMELGWTVNAEVGQDSASLKTKYEYELTLYNALKEINSPLAKEPTLQVEPRTLVIDFPVKSGSTITRADVNVQQQFDTYFQFQDIYTAHNSSNTISVKPDEWKEVQEIVYNNWDSFVGVSFLAYDGGSYKLAPYEEISEEVYHEMKQNMQPFDAELLQKYEGSAHDELDDTVEACEGGSCPIR